MMTSKRSTKNILTKINLLSVFFVLETKKAVIGRAYADDRSSGVQVSVNMFELIRRQRNQSAEQNHQIGLVEIFQTRNRVGRRFIFPTNFLRRIDFVV